MSVTSPITRFPNMRAVLKILYDNQSFEKNSSLDKEIIAKKMGKSVAIVNNALAMLRELKLVSGGLRYRNNKVHLLKNGKTFYEKLKTNNYDEIQEYSIKVIKESKSSLLNESYKLLKKDPQILHDEFGQIIRKKIRFDKTPKSQSTYANIGRTIKDVFCGMCIIDSDKARIRRRNIRGRFTGKLYINQRISNIIKTLDNFDENSIWNIDIPSHFDWDRQNALEITRTMIDLDMAYYIDEDTSTIKLTKKGEDLKNNLKTEKKKEILRDILLSHKPIKEIVLKIIDMNRDIASLDIGNLINDFNKTSWQPRTKYGHGSALLSWLKEADILTDSEKQFRFKISKDFNINIIQPPPELNWSLIDDKQFEDLCCDLLKSLNQFENVKKMGGAPGDLKRDITATERIETAFGSEYRKWLVQCKHYIKSKVTPDDLPSLINALPTHNSNGFLIMTSGELTPNARLYLENFNDSLENPYKANWIEKNKLEELIKNNPNLIKKYFM